MGLPAWRLEISQEQSCSQDGSKVHAGASVRGRMSKQCDKSLEHVLCRAHS